VKNLIRALIERFPSTAKLNSTFALILLVIHTWSVWQFLYRLPSYLMYLDLLNLLAVFAYYMAFAFVESIILLVLFGMIAIILPKNWYADHFEAVNLPIVLGMAVSAAKYQQQIGNTYSGISSILTWFGFTFLIVLSLALIFGIIGPLRKLSGKVMERISIMSYLYIPIGLFSLLVVVFRNLV